MIALHCYHSSYTLSEIFAQASRVGRISRADHARLMGALMETYISDEDRNSIERLLYAVRRKRIKVEGSSHFFVSIADIAS